MTNQENQFDILETQANAMQDAAIDLAAMRKNLFSHLSQTEFESLVKNTWQELDEEEEREIQRLLKIAIKENLIKKTKHLISKPINSKVRKELLAIINEETEKSTY